MDPEKKYKLNKFKKAGIAIGLTLVMAFSATACTGGLLQFASQSKQSSYSNTTNNSSITSDYINSTKSSELSVYDEDLNTHSITMNNYNYMNFINQLNSHDYSFEYAPYYGLDEALAVYNSTQINKSTQSDLLNNQGKLDVNKLIQKVQQNNKEYMSKGTDSINTFYSDMSTSDMNKICTLIAEVVNNEFNDIEIAKVANTLTKLTMFQRTGSASNAYITNNLTFVYNPTMTDMYADVKKITGENANPDEILKSVIVHEIMHLLEYSASDINDENGLESGICRMYNLPNKEEKVPVDSLWNSWVLEAAAELGMSDYLKIEPGTYGKKISYVRSYNLSRFNDLNLENQGLEDVAFNNTLESAYKDLELTNTESQKEFLKYMYSVEITQSDPDDFWKNYTAKTGLTPTDAEKTAIRMDIRTDAVKYLSKNFYDNLADAIHEGKVKDLDSAFYLIRNWELDIYGHLEYTKTNSLKHAEDFIKWHGEIQNNFFNAIAESNGMTVDNINTLYNEYNLQASIDDKVYDNCNFNAYNTYTSNYLTSAKKKYTTANFSRNSDVLSYINAKSQPTTEINTTK
ncbi:MAG: hypothetical protein IJA30_01290 [Bacilli bacterium]|nr:hypothetical protein [Bacilli bacterium]